MMKVSIYGAGYVGLVTAACLAELGNNVVCADIDENKIQQLQKGQSPIYEPGLTEMLQRHLSLQRISFTTDIPATVKHGSVQFIAVGTPSSDNGSADLRYVFEVAKQIAKYRREYCLIVNKSTVPVGTAEKVRQLILTQQEHKFSFAVVSNPEFLKEGHAIRDFMEPDRIIIGTNDNLAIKKMRKLYSPLIDNERRFIIMNAESAELTKYAANAFLATKISFINEISRFAELVSADIEKIREGIGTDPRIGNQFLLAGCGYGGSCFPKDVRALKRMIEECGLKNEILTAVENVNNTQKEVLLKKIQRYFSNNLKSKTIALWGLAFKPNTDDMREASSRILMEALWQQGATIQAYDPVANEAARQIYPENENFKLCNSAETALHNADALAIVTEWQEFREPNFQMIKEKLKTPVIFDGRNLYDPFHLRELGIEYFAIGRGNS